MPRVLFRRLSAAGVFLAWSGLLPAVAEEAGKFAYREITLDNGLRVITLEDFSCPIVNVQLWYHVGSKDEDPERQGFAHMFEHMMFRGTDRIAPEEHDRYVRRTGGNSNAYTSFDQTVYHETLPANQLELALWLEAERMAFLKIDQENFDTERKVVEEEYRRGKEVPYGDLPDKILAEVFKEHPYRWSTIGNIAHLRATSVPELRDFWSRYYVPNNAILVIVGSVKHEQAQELAKKYFGWIPPAPDPPRITIREPLPTQARSVALKEKNAPTPLVGIVYRGVSVGHPDAPALEMMGTILGGGESSRVYRDLVAEQQTAAFAGGGAFSFEQDGIFGVGAALPPFGGDTSKALQALEAQVETMRTELVSERELTKARNQMLAGLVRENLTVRSKASALGSAAVLEGDVSQVNQRLDAIRAVTREDLLRVARQYLAPERALKGVVKRNLLGMLFGKDQDEDPPITAEPEAVALPPGRAGVKRPADFPAEPPIADLLEFDPTLKFDTHTLPNGLKLVVVPNHEVPFVSVQLGLTSGAWTEEKPGVASMTLNMLTKGTEQHSAAKLADELETYAISLSAGGGMDTSSVNASCLTEHLERAVNLMAEVVLTPTFPPDEFSKLRRQVLTALTVVTNEPGYIADREFRRRMYGEHPYARTATGEIEDVRASQADDCRRWWSRFARPDMAVLIFAGDVERERAVALAESAFGAWEASGPEPQIELPPMPEPTETHIYLVDRPAKQSQIRAGHLGITRAHPDYHTTRVVTSYFGGAFLSRLNEAIRVKRGLTYGANGGFSAQRFAGQFRASTFTKIKSVGETVQVIFDEFKRLREEPPTQMELDDTKSYILGSFASGRETPQQSASELWLIESHGLPADYSERMLKQVAKTTEDDCVRVARAHVDASKMVVVVVGPADRLKDDLEKIAPVTVVKPDGAAVEPPDANKPAEP
jgi:zinc protease